MDEHSHGRRGLVLGCKGRVLHRRGIPSASIFGKMAPEDAGHDGEENKKNKLATTRFDRVTSGL